MRPLILLSLLAIAGPAHANKVALSFAMPEGTAVETSTETQTQQMAGQAQPASEFTSVAKLTATRSADGLVLTWSDVEVKMGEDEDPMQNAIMGAMGAIDLGLKVNGKGDVLGSVKDLDAQSAALEEAVRQGVRASQPEMSDAEFEMIWTMVGPMLEAGLSAEALWGRYKNDWEWRVSRWAGKKLVASKEQTETLSLPRPEFGDGVTIPAKHVYTVTPDVPCFDGDAATGCVRIVSTVTYDPDASRPYMEAFLGQVLGSAMPGVSLTLTKYADGFVQTLVTEPATLRFWSVGREARQDMSFSVMGQEITGLNTTSGTTTWAWE